MYYYIKPPVRLACLIHAASVHSEPESNSPKIIITDSVLTENVTGYRPLLRAGRLTPHAFQRAAHFSTFLFQPVLLAQVLLIKDPYLRGLKIRLLLLESQPAFRLARN